MGEHSSGRRAKVLSFGARDLRNEIFGHREDFHSLYDDELGVVQPDLSNSSSFPSRRAEVLRWASEPPSRWQL